MEKTKKILLDEPITVGGQEIAEVTIRRSNIGDEEDAMQRAIQMKRNKNDLSVEMCLMSIVAKLPYDVIRSMNGPDYKKLRVALNQLNGIFKDAPEKDADENPMTLSAS